MRKKILSGGFSDAEVAKIDSLVEKGEFCSRADALRCLVREGLQRRSKEN